MCVMGRELARLKRLASILIDPSSWGIDSITKHRTVLQTGMSPRSLRGRTLLEWWGAELPLHAETLHDKTTRKKRRRQRRSAKELLLAGRPRLVWSDSTDRSTALQKPVVREGKPRYTCRGAGVDLRVARL